MPDLEKTRERELLLRRLRELDQKLAENQRELWQLKKTAGFALAPRKTARLLSSSTFEHHFSQQRAVACRRPLGILISTKASLDITG